MTQNQSHIGTLYPSSASLKVFSSSLQTDRIIKTTRLALDTDHSLHEPTVTCQSWLFNSHKIPLCVSSSCFSRRVGLAPFGWHVTRVVGLFPSHVFPACSVLALIDI